MKLIEITDRSAWNTFVGRHPSGHPLQLWGWGEAKRQNGWQAYRMALIEGDRWLAAAQVLIWRIPLTNRYIAYIPRGPVGAPNDTSTHKLLDALVVWAREKKTIMYLRIEPAWTMGSLGAGWKKTSHSVQMSKTYTVDLTKSVEELLSVMSSKHRQYTRKSERDGVRVQRVTGNDLSEMYGLYEETARRASFGIHDRSYYESLHVELGDASHLYYAYYENSPVAFLWLAIAGETAYELYGGVNQSGADLKANYFLKWQVIRNMKTAGYSVYDFNGRLNEGVSRFKEGFGPQETDYIGTYDFVVRKFSYYIWEYLWPIVKPLGRKLMRLRHRVVARQK